MGTTIDEIESHLQALDVKFQRQNESMVRVGWTTETYKNSEGEQTLSTFIELLEQGEFLNLIVPRAFTIKESARGAAYLACLAIQWQTKMLQFELDHNDGELRLVIEIALEDASLTKQQLARMISALPASADRYFGVFEKINETGVFDAALLGEAAAQDAGQIAAGIIGGLPPEKVAEALKGLSPDQLRKILESLGS
jgi:hypothetical protein